MLSKTTYLRLIVYIKILPLGGLTKTRTVRMDEMRRLLGAYRRRLDQLVEDSSELRRDGMRFKLSVSGRIRFPQSLRRYGESLKTTRQLFFETGEFLRRFESERKAPARLGQDAMRTARTMEQR